MNISLILIDFVGCKLELDLTILLSLSGQDMIKLNAL